MSVSDRKTTRWIPRLSLAVAVVWFGVRGIERVAKLLIPSLAVLVVILAIRAVTLPGAVRGLEFLFSPDWAALADGRLLGIGSIPWGGDHLTADLADKAITWMRRHLTINPDRPFLMWWTPGAVHGPHHVAEKWADKYKGVFDDGYDVYAKETFERMQNLGNIIPEGTELAPMSSDADATGVDGEPWPELDEIRPWDSLNDDEKTVAAMDVLAPGIGEIIGGSQREERLDVLDARITEVREKYPKTDDNL